jgi:hypothetical protein
MQPGDVAGLALLNRPYAWIGISRGEEGFTLEYYEQTTNTTTRQTLQADHLWLRTHCNFLTERAEFFYSTDGQTFQPFGGPFDLIFQTRTFQGVRYSLFHYNTGGAPGGTADFRRFTVDEPHPNGLMRPIPYGKTITLASLADGAALAVRDGNLTAIPAGQPSPGGANPAFQVIDRGLGRVALRSGNAYLSVAAPDQVTLRPGDPGDAETFQWIENVYGDLILLSLATHRYLQIHPGAASLTADQPGPRSDRNDGVSLRWEAAPRD